MNADITLDKVNSKEIKSSEQLKLHTVDDQYENKPIERALHLISVGEEVQKLSVIQGIPELLEEDRTGCLQKIVPKMQQALINGSTELHITASLAIRSIIEENILSVDMFVRHFLHTVTQAMDSRDPAVANSWSETLIEAIKVLPVNVLQNEIAPIALASAQLAKPVSTRILSCKLIGELSAKYDPQTLKKDLVPTVLSLCQDVNGDVRAEIAKQLVRIAIQLGPELARTSITQPLIELSSDEVTQVKENAFVTVVETLQYFPPESLRLAILPLIKQMIVLAFKLEDSLLVTISKMFGKMCLGIEKQINDQEKELYVKWFITMAVIGVNQSKKDARYDRKNSEYMDPELSPTHRSTQCRQNCAFNFPLMAKFSQDLTKKSPLEFLHTSLKMLVSDPCYIVRKAIATGFNDVCLIYWKHCSLLKEDFIMLCRDDSIDVLDSLIPNLYTIMEIFLHNGVFRPDPHDEILPGLMRNLVKCEGTLSKGYKWRSYIAFLKQTRNFYRFVPPDLLYNTLITCFMRIVHTSRVVPVRMAALKNLLMYMRFTARFQHRKEIKDKIISEFCMSKNFYDRILYVRILPSIMDLFSTHYFKENFYLKTMRLFEDSVPNVRCSLVKLLPKLKAMIKMPVDNKLFTLLETTLVLLGDDKDKETKKLFTITKEAIISAEAGRIFPDDQKKYDEEKKLFFDKKEDSGGSRGKPARTVTPTPQRKVISSANASTQDLDTPPRPGTAAANVGRDGRAPPPRPRNLPRPREEEMSGQEKEFFIDAGIHLPDGVQQLPNNLPLNSSNSNNSSPLHKKWNSPRIPVRRPTNQRHSLQFTDFNKNITSSTIKEKSSISSSSSSKNNHRSYLPRPLSCINFQTNYANNSLKCDSPSASASLSKQRYISKLPVINRNVTSTNIFQEI